jgi:beta-lactamase regulating signal transducer with metallopeptidase domain
MALLPVLHIFVRTTSGVAGSAAASHGLIVLPYHWVPYLSAVWLVFAGFGMARVIAGVFHLHRVRANSTVISPAALKGEACETAVRAAETRAFELRVSELIRVPVAIGYLRPAIILPAYLLEELSPAQLSQVLLHEATHLLRYDDWTNLAQKIARALLFFHPVVWWLENKLTLEREMACDEAVVAETSDPRTYAECLTLLAEKSLFRRSLALAQSAVSRLRHTSLRVQKLLAPGSTSVRSWAATVGVSGVLVCSAVLGQTPSLVSFQSRTVATAADKQVTASRPLIAEARPASVAVRPQAAPAAYRHKERPLVRSNDAVAHTGHDSYAGPAVEARSVAPIEAESQVVLASHVNERPVPVVITTTTIVESEDGSGVSQQVWRMLRVVVYYPAPEQTAKYPRTI